MKNETNKQHTPGPWQIVKTKKIQPSDVDGWHVFSQSDKDKIYKTVCFTSSLSDAHLIASAPLLLQKSDELLKENETIIRMNAKQSETIEKLQALNAELLEKIKIIQDGYKIEIEINSKLYDALKIAKEHWNAPVQRKLQVMIDKQINSAIAKAEGKDLGG